MTSARMFSLFLLAVAVLFPASASTQEPDKRPGKLERNKAPGHVLTLTFQLTEKSWKDQKSGGNHAFGMPVAFEEGKTYQIDMTGLPLGMLRLEDPKGKQLDSDRGAAGDSRPRIIHEAKSSGKYRIICTSWHLRPQTGAFTLNVKEVSSDPKELAKPIELKLEKGRAAVETELEPRGPRYKDAPCKFLTIPLEVGLTYRVQMASGEFSPHVYLEGPDGKVVAEDCVKMRAGKPATVTFKPEKAGTYRIIAAQHDFRMGGPQFSLSVEEVKAP